MQLFPNPLIIPIGLLIGILVAAPVGPVNVLCIQRAIERGFWGGVAAGLGAVLGDGLIALFASLGVGAISGVVKYYRVSIQVIGGLALIAFGIKLYFTAPHIKALDPHHGRDAKLKDFVWDIPQTFFLTITNPGAVLGLFCLDTAALEPSVHVPGLMAPGCGISMSPTFIISQVVVAPTGTWTSQPLVIQPSWLGFQFFTQWFTADANFVLSSSNGLKHTVGLN